MSYAVAIIGLFAIILIHEAGHFLAARAVGIRATRFFIFFPPKVVSITRGDVEYGIGAIPLGGFVKLPGMFEPRAGDVAWRFERELHELASGIADPDQRARVMEGFAVVARAEGPDELGAACVQLAEQLDATAQLEFAGDPAYGRSWKRSVLRASRRLREVQDDCHPRAYWRAQLWRRMTVILAGPMANIIMAFVIFWVVAAFLNPVYTYSWRIGSVVDGGPAATAGVRAGDTIVEWNGVQPGRSERDAERFSRAVRTSLGKPIVLTVRAPGAADTPRTYRLAPVKIKGERRVGVATEVQQRFVRYDGEDPGRAVLTAGNVLVDTGSAVVTGLSRLVDPDNLDEVSSVVGIVKVAPAWAEAGNLVGYLGILSLAIAVYNLLPLLPMDGGHIAFGVIERLRRGRPLPRAAFERYSIVGLMLMLGLFAIGLRNDLTPG
jgi:regulator of sigma E protease